MSSIKIMIKDNRGAAAVEFAFISLFFVMALSFVLIVGLITYFNQALDFATTNAARSIMTGNAQKTGLSQAQFISTIVCPNLPVGITCSNIIVNLYTVTEAAGPNGYYTYANSTTTALTIPTLSNSGASYSLGSQQSYEYLQIIYPITALPKIFSSILGGGATYNGSPAFLLVSTAAFKNEQY